MGTAMAAVMPEDTLIHLASSATPTWTTLRRNGSSQWVTEPGGAVYTTPLNAGQGFFVEGASGTTPVFSGPVGNTSTKSIPLNVGFNIIGLSEGKALAASSAFNSASPIGNYTEALADQVILQNANGSWRRLIRQPTGIWYDMTSRGATTVVLNPGQAYYYIRRTSSTTVSF